MLASSVAGLWGEGGAMEHVGLDILGPFPVINRGNHYVLIAMDYFTKRPEAFAVPDQIFHGIALQTVP